jgi:hypothetical protein
MANGRVMHHELSPSLDDLVHPASLSALAGHPITAARRLPFAGGHAASGSHLLAIETNDGRGPRFIVKRVSLAWDWIMRATNDRLGREAQAWAGGLLDRLPPEITHPVLACAHDGDGWAILMRDVSDALFPPHDPYVGLALSTADEDRLLDGLAALHEAFWDKPEAASSACGYCHPALRYSAFSPETGRREGDAPDVYPRIIRDGWDLLPSLIDADTAVLVTALALDPRPLVSALARYPQTVVHGDPRPPNFGLVRSNGSASRVMLLDWQLAGPGAAASDLAWLLYCAEPGRLRPRETVIAVYRDRLAARLGSRFDEAGWRPQLALCLLGQMVRCAQDMAWAALRHDCPAVRAWAREALRWWCGQAIIGARWL